MSDYNIYYNVLAIERGTSVDGPGLRTAIYLAGCTHQCPGCHNPLSWNPQGGERMSLESLLKIVEEEGNDVTLTGGDPLMHPYATSLLAKEIARLGHRIWLYTGYTAEDIAADLTLRECVGQVDVIVDGRFVSELHDPDLRFRGSSNQRILEVTTTDDGMIVFKEWHDPLDDIFI